MSDTTNVMKGARSGWSAKFYQKRYPYVLDVSCICHLADLSIKSGIEALVIDIDQLSIDVFYYYHSRTRKQVL